MIQHTKQFGIYHWDTFDNETLLLGETDDLDVAEVFVAEHYQGRIRPDGADRVDIVDRDGKVVQQYRVG